MDHNWYRNTNWNDSIAAHFNAKLNRARRKEQYLCIQAYYLATTHTEVSLELLNVYFSMPNDSDHARAYVCRATALITLGRWEEAITCYEMALDHEAKHPFMRTQAYLELSFLIATKAFEHRYDQAVTLLDQHKEELLFPNEHFFWHASYALISAARGDFAESANHAHSALNAAACTHSGFRYHPTAGLVGEKHADLVQKLEDMLA